MKLKVSVLVLGLSVTLMGCGGGASVALDPIPVKPTQENRTADGELYTPSTQSLLRTHSWLEDVSAIELKTDGKDIASIDLVAEDDYYLNIRNLPVQYIVPRLHYTPNQEPDDFDALNLILAEYSRNSVSVPHGSEGDEMSHFLSNLPGKVPWELQGDFEFVPNRLYKPLRVSVINNCLNPGLWELNAVDRSGEIYHGWFDMPLDYYYDLVARTNKVETEFVKHALHMNDEGVKTDLDRLREIKEDLGTVKVVSVDEEVSFSSQGSRRKLHKQYVAYEKEGELFPPSRLSDVYNNPVKMSSFIGPGVYNFEEKMNFDFRFLASATDAQVKTVYPKTSYKFNKGNISPEKDDPYIEITINLADNEKLVLGNLPLHLLVEQEDFSLHGFGVGILHAGGFAERRKFLLEKGPRPSFAYLLKEEGGETIALNSHLRGVEQIFIRSHPNADNPHWEITVTSYERIVDLVRYRVDMPEALKPLQQENSNGYIPPIYFTYRDDNIN